MQIKWGRVCESTGDGVGVLTHSSLGPGGPAPSVLSEPLSVGWLYKEGGPRPGWRLWVAHLHLEVPSVLQSTLLKGPQRNFWLCVCPHCKQKSTLDKHVNNLSLSSSESKRAIKTARLVFRRKKRNCV